MNKIIGGVTTTPVPIDKKVDKVPEATGGNLAVFVDPEGGIADCGIPCSKVVTTDNIGNYAPSPGYAGVGVAGVVKLATACGLKMGAVGSGTEGCLSVDPAPESLFQHRTHYGTGSTLPVTMGNIDFAVKTCLTDGKQVVTWSDEEKQAARALLGAVGASDVGDIATALDAILAMQSAIIGGEV